MSRNIFEVTPSYTFEYFKNHRQAMFYDKLDRFLYKHGKKIEDYNDKFLKRISDDHVFCIYSDVMEIPEIGEFLKSWDLGIAFVKSKDYKKGLKRDFVALIYSPKIEWNPNIFFRLFPYFSNFFHGSKMFSIRPRNEREDILKNGLKPRKDFRLKTHRGFEFDDEVKDMKEQLTDRYDDNELDIWEVTLSDEIELHKDAAFRYGGYVSETIKPDSIKLIDMKDFPKYEKERYRKIKLELGDDE